MTANKFVRCIKVESRGIPCYVEDIDKVWRESHMGDEGTSRIRFLAMYRCEIQYFSPQNVRGKISAVCLVPQQHDGGPSVHLSRDTALRYFYIDGGVVNQEELAQDSLPKIGLNEANDWTQFLPPVNVPSRDPPLPAPALR